MPLALLEATHQTVAKTTDGMMPVSKVEQDGRVGHAHRVEPDLTVSIAMPNGDKMSTTVVQDCATDSLVEITLLEVTLDRVEMV